MNEAEERISELEHRTIEITYSDERENRLKEKEQRQGPLGPYI